MLLVILSVFCLFAQPSAEKDRPQPDWTGAEAAKVTGMIETGSGEVYIVENWTSRSRVSYLVYGDFTEELEKREGEIVTVSGMVLHKGMWSKEILIKKIITYQKK